ncbi:PREDICTED: uncharacterized protein LOC109156318 [Ipomoea nil]|uniref:uncharacterized protein LOC109156318 n=1 Tax=Ipomoea nil TaxID=35883 RepID=UPI000901B0F3|nr:PREDICTED: uncharacterized protein LOC109156318 [Ipomoea nil]
MAVWVRLPGLPVEYFRDGSVKKILDLVGKPIKLDIMTTEVDKVKFARAAVEIDLLKPLVSMVWVSDRVQQVEYEGLHVICFDCGEVGHVSSKCPKKVATEDQSHTSQTPQDVAEAMETTVQATAPMEKPREKYGPWMIVSYKTDKHQGKGQVNGRNPKGKPPKGKEKANLPNTVAAGERSPAAKQTSKSRGQDVEVLHETPVFVEGETSARNKNPGGVGGKKKGRKKKKNVAQDTAPNDGEGDAGSHANQSQSATLARQGVLHSSQIPGSSSSGNVMLSTHKEGGGQTSLPHNGGLLLVWNKDMLDLEVVSSNSQTIHCKILEGGNSQFYISFAYVRPNMRAKEVFWSECKTFRASRSGPWVMLGDFNDIAISSDHWGSDHINMSNMARFCEAYEDCGLMEVPSTGAAPSRRHKPFRFEAAWLTREDYKDVWKKAWSIHPHNVVGAINEVTNLSKKWNEDVFGNIFKRKRLLQARIQGIQTSPWYYRSRGLQVLEKKLIDDLNLTLSQEELLWVNHPDVITPEPHSSPRISQDEANNLSRLAGIDEVKKAVFGMKRMGSPGPDGIQAAFYQDYWDEVGQSITMFVNEALVTGKIPVLVNRLRPLMIKLIGPHQNSFLPGRSTLDNIVLTQEIIHSINHKKGKKGSLVMKIDLHKAYDSIDWGFLDTVLTDFGFPKRLINLVLFSLKESSISILWNGEKLSPFEPGRGLRQGDPLAPYLFILAMEKLSYLIQEQVRASEGQIATIMDCLNRFSRWVKRRMGDTSNIPVTENLGKYLGIPILQKRINKSHFNYILDNMKRKLNKWKADTLSLAGDEFLDFLWGSNDAKRKIHLINWREVCRPRDQGGMGLRMAKDFNTALLAKLAWQILNNTEKLWVSAMKHKYLQDNNFFTSITSSNASWGWKSIIKGRSTIETGAQCDLITVDRNWNVDLLSELLPPDLVCKIRATPIPIEENTQDRLSWPDSTTGTFSVLSAYNIIAGNSNSEDWNWVWKINCVEKVKSFLWLLLKGKLLTGEERRNRRLTTDASCKRCPDDDESIDHIFRRCPFATDCWDLAKDHGGIISANFKPVNSWIKDNCTSKKMMQDDIPWNVTFVYILWLIWKARNGLIFNNNYESHVRLINTALSMAKEATSFIIKHKGVVHGYWKWIYWEPPQHGWMKLNTDGALSPVQFLSRAVGPKGGFTALLERKNRQDMGRDGLICSGCHHE